MEFNLNEFLVAVSFALDFVEEDIIGAKTNHGKRVAYNAVRIGEVLGLDNKGLHDAISLAILHDNGLSQFKLEEITKIREGNNIDSFEDAKNHCIIGESNLVNYPFLKDQRNIIRYHHESYDGTGYFGLIGEEIPLLSQIISFSDWLDNHYKLSKLHGDYKHELIENINKIKGKKFSKDICEAFFQVIDRPNYRLDIKDDYVRYALNRRLPENKQELSLQEIVTVTNVFSSIIDSKSKFTRRHSKELAEKAEKIACRYKYDKDETYKLVIAANLHDIGKLAVSNNILEAPRKLTLDEFAIIESHTYYTRVALSQIKGFEDITEWAANHHEKLNGRGYPYGKSGVELDFNSRLMGCLDIYQALTEERPYRRGLSHDETMKIMWDMVKGGYIEGEIVKDIDILFR